MFSILLPLEFKLIKSGVHTTRQGLYRLGERASRLPEGDILDVTNVVVDGHQHFMGLGIPRDEMPQIPSGKEDKFLEGLTVTAFPPVDRDPYTLFASQSQLSAGRAFEMTSLQRVLDKPIFVSNDNYVMDGHHRWLAAMMIQRPLPVRVINLPIKDLLAEAEKFNAHEGIDSKAI